MVTSLATVLSGSLLLLGILPGAAAELKVDSHDAIVESSKSLAKDVMTFYTGEEPGNIPGLLSWPPPNGDYYWYMGANFFATYLDYWHLTGDDSYKDATTEALLFQVGPNDDYLPPNWTVSMGNDDQCFWGSAALLAAEYEIPTPEGEPRWIDIAKNVWQTQASPDRHDDQCGGGLRWQILPSNAGYEWKATSANGCFFNMGARLARFTGNSTFADYSEDTWNWLTGVGFIDEETWAVYDGAHVDTNCTDISKFQWSQNAAMLTQGAAFMYNYTNGSDIWRDRAEKLSNALLETFFPDGVAYESACEGIESCTTDMIFMKGYVHRWLASATQVAPFLAEKVLPVLQTSAEAAVKQCVESDNGTVSHSCGFYWRNQTFVDPAETDGTTGAGENLDVFAAVSSLLIADAAAPATDAGADNSSDSSGNGQGGSPSGTSDTSSPSGTAGSNSGAGRLGAGVTKSLLVSAMAALAWVL
ncbi:hypothetical protein J7T55_014163 [Diaporthe amygdali]|uniref:uncharacterized protein n=1 Tax=Phomopsis amygdali TaxID=1214568 RepID=UPI0022FE88D3|nr:uncharacterized protein J7T55_014163 [Diaporthe amygdali]KAJ0109601.1 hypothetical protein J7T55_014163 [Diaporthe amygdali]